MKTEIEQQKAIVNALELAYNEIKRASAVYKQQTHNKETTERLTAAQIDLELELHREQSKLTRLGVQHERFYR